MNKQQKREQFSDEFYQGIAHRGLHNETFTENGLKAFKNAIDHDFAFELDIHLTLDHQLVVCHDSELLRTTGKQGIIEDLTFKDIRDNYRLLDGEVVPSFQEVLALNHEKKLIVVELKVYKKNYKALAKEAMVALKEIMDPKKIVIISFDPRALLAMKKAPFKRELLVCKDKEWARYFLPCFDSVDLEKTLVKSRWALRYHKKGGIINVWTIESIEDLKMVTPYVDTVTFQNFSFQAVKDSFGKNTNQL